MGQPNVPRTGRTTVKPTAWTILPLALLVTACGTVNKPAPTNTIQALRTQPRISVAHYQPAPLPLRAGQMGTGYDMQDSACLAQSGRSSVKGFAFPMPSRPVQNLFRCLS